jgi:hypothetical protein
MKYKCIRCNFEWGEWKDYEDQNFFSHGVCKECVKTEIVPKIRLKQCKEGNWGCFGTTYHGFCDQNMCKYKSVCLKLNLDG